jgi:uncharacterized protein YjbJ (UPF0337 family)
MSSTEDKARGTTNDVVGNVKQAVGRATDNETNGSGRRSAGNQR